jgi:5-methylcytosine-specific restriction endonuclease McrA
MTRRRKFHRRVYLAILRRQKLWCAYECGKKLSSSVGYEFDHQTPLALGGIDAPNNLRAVCIPCHKKISAVDIRMIRKADRQRRFHLGAKKRRGRAMQSRGFDARLRRRFDGRMEVRT